ncbi:MAG TPA: glutathione S-transferase family protein [Geminicoccaceae bacterium]|nr:glutathione S-transferase family protein [Geminicoccaceae bacterium]
MRLYNFDVSPFAAKVRLAVYAKGLDVELAAPPEGGPRSPEYRAINPLGKVPALVLDDGRVIPESEVIVEYLEDRFPTPSLRPDVPEERARMRLVARICDAYLMPPLGRLFGQLDPAKRDPAVAEPALEELEQRLASLETFLTGDPWAVAPRLTLADCALVPLLFIITWIVPAFERPDPLAGNPKLKAVWQTAQGDPAAAKVLEEMRAGRARMQARRG